MARASRRCAASAAVMSRQWCAAVLGCSASHSPSLPMSRRAPLGGSVTWQICRAGAAVEGAGQGERRTVRAAPLKMGWKGERGTTGAQCCHALCIASFTIPCIPCTTTDAPRALRSRQPLPRRRQSCAPCSSRRATPCTASVTQRTRSGCPTRHSTCSTAQAKSLCTVPLRRRAQRSAGVSRGGRLRWRQQGAPHLMGPAGLPSTTEGATSWPAASHRATSSLFASRRWLPLSCAAAQVCLHGNQTVCLRDGLQRKA